MALDFDCILRAREFVHSVSPNLCRLKIGKQMFTLYGPQFVRECIDYGFDVFLDLKFHDIPHTVGAAVSAACELGVWMLTVHASGGEDMLNAARSAVDQFSGRKPLLVGVTLLTSLNQQDLRSQGIVLSLDKIVMNLAQLAHQAQLDGVVCSAKEAGMIKATFTDALTLVTPGIRLTGDDSTDQKRVVTPRMANQAGADYLVIGRSITQSLQPVDALRQCLDEISLCS